MLRYIICILITFLFSTLQINAQSYTKSSGEEIEIPYPQIPRVTAYEAYLKYKEGKAIIFHAGGMSYSGRHILGAFNLDVVDELRDERLQKFPKTGIEIFTYCY